MKWSPGDVIVERQVWRGSVVAGFPTIVVANEADSIVTYVAPGAEFGFVDGAYPGPGGQHPWYGRSGWQGHGMLSVVSKTEPVAVQHFWSGPDREFVCWYLNLQEPMRPTEIGFDNQDLELDIVIAADGTWSVKDDELLDQRVAEGRWTAEEGRAIRVIADRLVREVVVPRTWWWDVAWATWQPEPKISAPRLPADWADVPAPPFDGIMLVGL